MSQVSSDVPAPGAPPTVRFLNMLAELYSVLRTSCQERIRTKDVDLDSSDHAWHLWGLLSILARCMDTAWEEDYCACYTQQTLAKYDSREIHSYRIYVAAVRR